MEGNPNLFIFSFVTSCSSSFRNGCAVQQKRSFSVQFKESKAKTYRIDKMHILTEIHIVVRLVPLC